MMDDSIDEAFERHNIVLEKAYQAGNLGALKDIVYWSREFKQPLPEWANRALAGLLDDLANGDEKRIVRFKTWFSKYKQKMKDLYIYEIVRELRGDYHENFSMRSEWSGIYGIAAMIFENRINTEISDYAIEKAYKRCNKELKTNPQQYTMLHTFMVKRPSWATKATKELSDNIKLNIKAGKPRNNKKLTG